MAMKRKKVVLTLEQKIKALDQMDSGVTAAKIARDLGVGESTVKDWKKNKEQLRRFVGASTSGMDKRSTLKKPTSEELDAAVWMWFVQQRNNNFPVSGAILKEKAVSLDRKINSESNFVASEGWLTRWKKRHGVHHLTVSGEKLASDEPSAISFIGTFSEMIATNCLQKEQIYNLDETGLNYKMLPTKTLARSEEKFAAGYKKSKERITIALCANAAGTHKLPLFVVGKSAKPRAFKHLNMNALPVHYRAQRSAWMDTKIFTEWFMDYFCPSVRKHLRASNIPPKAILLLDNAPSHPDGGVLVDGDIKAVFLPPNVTPLIQPMDQGVIECLKRRYRRKLMTTIFDMTEEIQEISQALKCVNMKDVIYLLSLAWEEIPPETLQKSWSKILDNCDEYEDEETEEENKQLLSMVSKIKGMEGAEFDDIVHWHKEDDIDVPMLSDAEIVSVVQNPNSSTNEEEDPMEPEPSTITHKEGKELLEKALLYVEQQPTSTREDILNFKKWWDHAARLSVTAARQKKITEYFSK